MRKLTLFVVALLGAVMIVGCSSSSDEGSAPVTEKPANFKAQEGSAAGGGATPQASTGDSSDRPGAGAPPGG